METVDITAEPRREAGKAAARAMRRGGKFPGVLYGPKRQSAPLVLDRREFERKLGDNRHTGLIRLQSGDQDLAETLVLVKEEQRHPVAHTIVHVDFYEVDVNEKIRVMIPLDFVGKAEGVELGGILQPVRREVEVSCLPLEIPSKIEVDVSALGIHDAIHISDLVVPEGVEIPYDADITLVTVLAPVVEEVKDEEAEEAAEGEEKGEETDAEKEKAEEAPAEG